MPPGDLDAALDEATADRFPLRAAHLGLLGDCGACLDDLDREHPDPAAAEAVVSARLISGSVLETEVCAHHVVAVARYERACGRDPVTVLYPAPLGGAA